MTVRILTFLLLVALIATPAAALNDECLTPVQTTSRFAEIDALFAAPPAIPIETETGVSIEGRAMEVEVMVARIGPDGKITMACVTSAEAAKRFLEAPVERIRVKAAEN